MIIEVCKVRKPIPICVVQCRSFALLLENLKIKNSSLNQLLRPNFQNHPLQSNLQISSEIYEYIIALKLYLIVVVSYLFFNLFYFLMVAGSKRLIVGYIEVFVQKNFLRIVVASVSIKIFGILGLCGNIYLCIVREDRICEQTKNCNYLKRPSRY